MSIEIAPRNAELLKLAPFIVATEDNLRHFDLHPWSWSIDESARFDPLRSASVPFLERLTLLDRLSFGPEGMPMPRWLFLNGAGLQGAIVGLARRASSIGATARSHFQPDTDDVWIPYAMYIAIPTVVPGRWFGHNLASLGPQLQDEPLRGLGSLTKALALRVLRCREQVGATQWDSKALYVHSRLGPLSLSTAWTPAHSEPATLTYMARIDEPTLYNLARDPRGSVTELEPDELIDSDDHVRLQALQVELEADVKISVAARPRPSGRPGVQRVPIAYRSGK